MSEKITLKTTTKPSGQVVHYVQGATLIPLDFVVEDFVIPDGATAQLFIKRPSGSEVYVDGQVAGQTITIKPTAQTFAEAGAQAGQLQIIASGGILVTYLIQFAVERNLIDGSAAPAGDEYNALTQATRDAVAATASATEAAQRANDAADQAVQKANDAATEAVQKANEAADQAAADVTEAIEQFQSAGSDMGGATASSAGSHGFVPAPQAGDQSKYLAGDATWKAVPSKTSELTNDSGFLTPTDIADYIIKREEKSFIVEQGISGGFQSQGTTTCIVEHYKSGKIEIHMKEPKSFSHSSLTQIAIGLYFATADYPNVATQGYSINACGYMGNGGGYQSRVPYRNKYGDGWVLSFLLVGTGAGTGAGTSSVFQADFCLWP